MHSERLLKRALRSADKFEYGQEPGIEVLTVTHRAKQAETLRSHLNTARLQGLHKRPVPNTPKAQGKSNIALLELLEKKWPEYPGNWSVTRRVLDCSLNPPAEVPGEHQPVPVALIDVLSKCPLGRAVLKDALLHIPTSRLSRNRNCSNIEQALKQRSIQSYHPPKGFRSYRGYASDLAQTWENKRPVPLCSPRTLTNRRYKPL
jgi:hypothetical protein